MKRLSSILVVCLSLEAAYAQHEGGVVYQWTLYNPNVELLDSARWAEVLESTYGADTFEQHYYYKESQYMFEMNAPKHFCISLYRPETNMLHVWERGTELIQRIDCAINQDTFEEWLPCDAVDTILESTCQCLEMKSKMSSMKIWYNTEVLPQMSENYPDHNMGNWELMIEKIGCIPLKYEVASPFMKYTSVAIEISNDPPADSLFEFPAGVVPNN